ncbi:MAG: right-handed parallel beta-helix repeat-containing protein [Nibricoccus sp.]
MHKILAVFLLSTAFASGAIIDPTLIPSDNAWTNAGVSGGIPNRTNIYQTLTNGSTIDQIQTAINNCPSGQVVKLGPGTYVMTTAGLTMRSGVTLRGSGTTTILQYNGTADFQMLGGPGGGPGNKFAITSSVTRGSTTFTSASLTGVTAGTYVAISHTNPVWVTARSYGNNAAIATWLANNNPTATMVQIVKVTGVSGSTVTFTPAIYLDMPNSPQYQVIAMATGIGVEDLVLEKTQSAGGGSTLGMSALAESWMKNCVIKWPQATAIRIANSYGCTIRNCTIDSTNFAVDHESGRSYGIFFFDYNSNHLVENCVVMGARHALVFEGGGSGIVMAHNASVACRNNDVGDYSTITEDQDTHGAHPYMNLYEGNVVSRIVHDNTWGSSSHNLNFRV